VRAGLDSHIGRLAAERCTAVQVEALRRLLKEMERAARKRSVDDYYRSTCGSTTCWRSSPATPPVATYRRW
jgi:DNA-binding FadR family transcriptional regulator